MDRTETYIKTFEHRQKLSIAMLGNQNQEKVHSPETRAKISESISRRMGGIQWTIPKNFS